MAEQIGVEVKYHQDVERALVASGSTIRSRYPGQDELILLLVDSLLPGEIAGRLETWWSSIRQRPRSKRVADLVTALQGHPPQEAQQVATVGPMWRTVCNRDVQVTWRPLRVRPGGAWRNWAWRMCPSVSGWGRGLRIVPVQIEIVHIT